jgi:hypothetical protein
MLLVAGVLAVQLCGCSTPRAPLEGVLPDPLRTAIHERASHSFARATVFKPAETVSTNLPAFKFAPLILQEMPEDGPGAATQSLATVCFHVDKVAINGRLHDRFAYLWRYDAETEAYPGLSLPAQGIRITLDSEGEPAIWEVLADSSGGEILYVSESLETAAAARFKKPLSGRRFAVERDLREAPRTVVAQLIPEGPLPMGPIVYLRAGTHDVTAVVCRCMPVQTEALVGQISYHLAAGGQSLEPFGDSTGPLPVVDHWPAFSWVELERRLRLPRRF